LFPLEDAVNPTEVEHDGARQHRRRTAVREILAARDRPQRDARSVGGLDDLLHLLDGGRCDGGMGPVARVVVRNRVGIVVTDHLLAGEHPFLADDLPESLQGLGHRIGGYARREWFCHDTVSFLKWFSVRIVHSCRSRSTRLTRASTLAWSASRILRQK